MVEFTLFRIPIRIEPIFWITLGFIGFIWNSNNQLPSDAILMQILLFVIAGFISILIHELGHALMIKKYKLPTQIVLSSFGGYATHPSGILTRTQSFLMTLAGPLLQFIFGISVYFSLGFMNLENMMIITFFIYLYGVSIIWAIFNCVPVIPLDGGRMLEAAMGPRRIRTTLMISTIVAVILCVVGFAMQAPIMGIFMAMFAFQNYQEWEKFK